MQPSVLPATTLSSAESGSDRLDGGIGVDNMQGGVGDDVYVVDNGADFVFEAAAAGTDTIVSSISTTLNIASRANVENLTLIGGAVVGRRQRPEQRYRRDQRSQFAPGSCR